MVAWNDIIQTSNFQLPGGLFQYYALAMHMILVELDVWQIGDWCCGNFTSGRSSFFWPNRILLYGETHLHRMYPVEKECANLSLIWICRHCAPLALSFHYATLAFTLMSGCSKEKRKERKDRVESGRTGCYRHSERNTTTERRRASRSWDVVVVEGSCTVDLPSS